MESWVKGHGFTGHGFIMDVTAFYKLLSLTSDARIEPPIQELKRLSVVPEGAMILRRIFF